MAFPVSYSGYPTSPVPNPFMSVDMSGIPGAFGTQPPLAMGVPGLLPGMNSMGMGGMGLDPFSTVMPPMGIDPMTGMPLGGSMPMGIDPMTGMPLMAGSTGMPTGIDPMTGMPIGLDPFGGMQCGGFAPPGVMPPPMALMGIDPFGGMVMGGNPMGEPMPPSGGFYAPAQPQQQQQPQNPIKQMLMMLIQMKLFQQFLNPGANEPPVDPAAGDPATDGSATGGEVADNATALDIIADSKNFKDIGGADGNISFLDLSRAARTSKNADVKAAAEYITKENPALFKQLEKLARPGDGVFTEDDLGKALQTTSIVQGDASTDSVNGGNGNDILTGGDGNDVEITDNITALDQLSDKFDEIEQAGADGHGGKVDGHLTMAELSRAASSEDADPSVKNLAKYLRKSGLFTQLDELDTTDGVSMENITAAYQDPDITQGTGQPGGTPAAEIDTSGVTEEQAIKTLNTNFGKFDGLDDPKNKNRNGKGDNKLSAEDLDAIINSHDKNITDDIKKAAKFMKDNSTIGKLDKSEKDDSATSNVNESNDGFISKDTLNSWATDYNTLSLQANGPTNLKSAMAIISANIDIFTGGDSSRKSVSRTDFMKALNSADPKYDAVKAAVQYLKDHPEEFNILDQFDSSDDTADGSVLIEVINQAAVDGTDLDFGFKTTSTDANRTVLQWLKDKFDTIKNCGTSGHKRIERTNLLAALADSGYSAKEKAMIKYALNVKQNNGQTLWNSIGGDDGQTSYKDLENALNGDLSPAHVSSEYIGD